MVRTVELIDYLPNFIQEYKEVQQIMSVESEELQSIEDESEVLKDNQFINTCDEKGLTRFETLLNITPIPDDTHEERIFRIMTVWNDEIPYSFRVLEKKLKMLCGEDGYKIQLINNDYKIVVKIALISKSNFNDVKSLLQRIVPCNIVIDLDLLYNQYSTLTPMTHSHLKQYTYDQLRNEVLS